MLIQILNCSCAAAMVHNLWGLIPDAHEVLSHVHRVFVFLPPWPRSAPPVPRKSLTQRRDKRGWPLEGAHNLLRLGNIFCQKMRAPREEHVKFKEAQTSRKVSGPAHGNLAYLNVHELNSRSVCFRLIKVSSPQTVSADKITPLVPNPAKSRRGRHHLSMHVFLSRQK